MAAPLNMCTTIEQHGTVRFLWAKGIPAGYLRLQTHTQNKYGILIALPWQQWLHECVSVCTLRVLLDLWLPRFGSVLETNNIRLVTYSPDVISVGSLLVPYTLKF
jgi:hypothetical protein